MHHDPTPIVAEDEAATRVAVRESSARSAVLGGTLIGVVFFIAVVAIVLLVRSLGDKPQAASPQAPTVTAAPVVPVPAAAPAPPAKPVAEAIPSAAASTEEALSPPAPPTIEPRPAPRVQHFRPKPKAKPRPADQMPDFGI